MTPPLITVTLNNGGTITEIADKVLIGARITQGADDLWDQPDPPTLSMIVLDETGLMRDLFAFTTHVTVTADATTRFVGTVTDIEVTWEDDLGWVLQVIGVGPKTAARTLLLDPRPSETAAARIQAAWTAAGLPIYDVDTTASVTLLATTQPATVSALTAEAAHADIGLIAERRDGSMWYRGRNSIAASQLAKAVLPADGVFPDSRWVKSIGDLSSRVLCRYGTGDPQQTATAEDTNLTALLGRVAETVHAENYTDAGEAQTIATEVLSRRAAPGWRTTSLRVDLALDAYNNTRTQNVLDLEGGDVVWVTGAPATTPAGTSETYVLLGWDETLDGNDYVIDMRVVEYALLRDPARWGNVTMSWATAGSAPVGSYFFTPPTLAPGVGA